MLAALTVLNVAERQIKEAGQRIKPKRLSSLPPFTALSFSSISSLLSLDDIILHRFDFLPPLSDFRSPFGAFLSSAHDVR